MEEFSDFSISLSCHSGISPAADSRTHLSPVIQINMKIYILVLLFSAALLFVGPETADATYIKIKIKNNYKKTDRSRGSPAPAAPADPSEPAAPAAPGCPC
ncbi:hypothetical protein EPR50_G00057770 [Perca flavescens]|uniref:Uncharacterized protein n=1 Tax=Perca flavescens TaxID=8167 RepID=A0A484D7L7_PERFV|nr:hypothetical protein EPR50_G00057770 [Perca flavescens]